MITTLAVGVPMALLSQCAPTNGGGCAPAPPAVTQPGETASQANASRMAADYLDSMSFSRQGLIDQLQYEGFTLADATHGVDVHGFNWYAQSIASAAEYLDFMSFSRQGLIDQLVYEGFTQSEAVYGVDVANTNWYAQAIATAADYLERSAFSRQGLIDQLLYEGFTQSEAVYAVNTTGL
jgi:hypothetical protein